MFHTLLCLFLHVSPLYISILYILVPANCEYIDQPGTYLPFTDTYVPDVEDIEGCRTECNSQSSYNCRSAFPFLTLGIIFHAHFLSPSMFNISQLFLEISSRRSCKYLRIAMPESYLCDAYLI